MIKLYFQVNVIRSNVGHLVNVGQEIKVGNSYQLYIIWSKLCILAKVGHQVKRRRPLC